MTRFPITVALVCIPLNTALLARTDSWVVATLAVVSTLLLGIAAGGAVTTTIRIEVKS